MKNQSQKKMKIFIAGGTGYVGRALVPLLLERHHSVRCLVREKSVNKLPKDCIPVFGDALNNNSYKKNLLTSDVFVHLVGVSHPSPAKKDLFRKIDLVSLKQSVEAAVNSGIKQFIYISVAHPAPVMKEYIKVRMECEEFISSSGLNASILRPWYVLGPGHRWPYLFIPFYKLFEKIPSAAEGAKRLGLVTIRQLTQKLIHLIENPVQGIRIIEVPGIRNGSN